MAEEKLFESRVKAFLISERIYPAGYPREKMEAEVCGWFFKVWGGGYQKAGIPDLIINIRGHFIAVELKAEKGKPSDLQLKNIRMINVSNGSGIILYPSGFDRFTEFVKGVKQCKSAIPAWSASYNANSDIPSVIWKESKPSPVMKHKTP